MNNLLALSILISMSFNCGTKAQSEDQLNNKTYLALGDSYTIGESVAREDSFPYQLISKLNNEGLKMNQPKVIAVTGWTSADLISGIEQTNISKKFDFVTLLIGVNNQYRHESLEAYRQEFVYLLSKSISYSSQGKSSVFVLSIPDWGVTPFGQQENSKIISEQIDEFNVVNKQESLRAGVQYIDITPSSRLANRDRSLIAADGLHPSKKMYSEWVKLILPQVKRQFDK